MTQPDSYNWGSSNSTDTAYFRTVLSPMSAALILNAYAGGDIPDNQDHNTLFRNNYLWQQHLLSRQKSSENTLLRSTGTATWNGATLTLSANLDFSFRKDLGEQVNRIASGAIALSDGQVLVVRRDESSASPVTLSSVAYGSLALGTYAIVAETSLTATDREYQTVVFRRKGTDLEVPVLGLIFSTGDTITFGKSSISGLTLTGTVPFKTDSAVSRLDMYAAGAGVYYPEIYRKTSRGTVAAPTISQNGDVAFLDAGYFYDGDQYLLASQDYVYSATAPANNATTANRLFSLSGGGSSVETLFGMFGATSSIGLRDGGKFYLDMDASGVTGDTYLYHTSNSIFAVAGASPAFTASAGHLAIGEAGNAILTLGGAPTSNGSGYVRFTNSNSQINWQIATNFVASGDLTFTPSTAAGGQTYTTPVASFSNAGKLTLTNEMLLPDVDPPTANYINRNSGVKCYCSFVTTNASTAGSQEDYNLSSLSASSYDVTCNWDTDFSTSTNCFVATVDAQTFATGVACVIGDAVGSCTVKHYDFAGLGISANWECGVVGYGKQ